MAYQEQIHDIQVYSPFPMESLTDKDSMVRITIDSTEAFDSSSPTYSSSPRSTEAVAELTIPSFSSKSIHEFCGSHNVAVPDVCLAAWLIVLAQDGHTDSPRAEYLVTAEEISSNANGVAMPRVSQAQISGGLSALSLVQKLNADRHDLGRNSLSHNDSWASSQAIVSLLTFSPDSTSTVAKTRSLKDWELDLKASSISYQNCTKLRFWSTMSASTSQK
jgi:hypothetical protein